MSIVTVFFAYSLVISRSPIVTSHFTFSMISRSCASSNFLNISWWVMHCQRKSLSFMFSDIDLIMRYYQMKTSLYLWNLLSTKKFEINNIFSTHSLSCDHQYHLYSTNKYILNEKGFSKSLWTCYTKCYSPSTIGLALQAFPSCKFYQEELVDHPLIKSIYTAFCACIAFVQCSSSFRFCGQNF